MTFLAEEATVANTWDEALSSAETVRRCVVFCRALEGKDGGRSSGGRQGGVWLHVKPEDDPEQL